MTKIFNLDGTEKGEIKLPKVFSFPYRPDIIKRAVLAVQSNRRQPYGSDPLAGKRTSAHYHGVRVGPHHMMNVEMSRMKRIHGGPPALELRARFVPQAVKGRRVHPPKIEKCWKQKINKKEARAALQSAIAATGIIDIVKSRGYLIPDIQLPIVIDNGLQKISKTKELKKIITSLKLEKELEKASKKKIRAGKGKMRGRKYKKRKSFLFVIEKDEGIKKAVKNIPGADICNINNLNVELLAPGAQPGRLTIFTESAINKLSGEPND